MPMALIAISSTAALMELFTALHCPFWLSLVSHTCVCSGFLKKALILLFIVKCMQWVSFFASLEKYFHSYSKFSFCLGLFDKT